MLVKMNNYNIPRVLLIILSIKLIHCSDRKIEVVVNPNCDSICLNTNVTTVYLRSEGPNDALHYIWDFTGKPSVLFAVTGPSATIDINWAWFIYGKPESIRFTEIPKYSFGMVVLKIYEFNDVNDTGFIDTTDKDNINVFNTKLFRWDRKTISNNSKYWELGMEGTDFEYRNMKRNGSINFLLNRFWTLDHSDIMPHILHSENSTQIDIVIDKFQTNSTFKNSRFAIELLIIGNHNAASSMNIDVKKTLDDEHTPGIFQMVEITTPVCEFIDGKETCSKDFGGGYLQWRPVSYTAANRDVSSSTEAAYSPLTHVINHSDSTNNSLLYSFYGHQVDNMLLEKFIISLGDKGDGFYKKGNYSSWTFTIGYGTPPDEQFSFLVIMIISIGLGLPAIIILAAGIYMCARRRYKKTDTLSLNS